MKETAAQTSFTEGCSVGLRVSDLRSTGASTFSPVWNLKLHLQPFVRTPWSLAHHFQYNNPGRFLSQYQNAYSEIINNYCVVMNSEYVFLKLSASHFSVVLQMPRQPVEFKEGSASGSVFGFSWASFSFIWFCDNGKSEITRTLCELLVWTVLSAGPHNYSVC